MSTQDYNKILSTVNTVTSDYTYMPDPNSLICIDTSNNRIGINTLNPTESIDISGGAIRTTGLHISGSDPSAITVNSEVGFNSNGLNTYTMFNIKNGIIVNAT
jgi:hypothetical protein